MWQPLRRRRKSGSSSCGKALAITAVSATCRKRPFRSWKNMDGRIPEDFETLLSLKGIGRYTAGAIASIAYGKKVPAVDGNVLRVYARLTENRGDIMKQSVRKAVENELTERMPEDRTRGFQPGHDGTGSCSLCSKRNGKVRRMSSWAFLPCQKARNCRRTSGKSTEKSPHHRTAHGPCDPGRSQAQRSGNARIQDFWQAFMSFPMWKDT